MGCHVAVMHFLYEMNVTNIALRCLCWKYSWTTLCFFL